MAVDEQFVVRLGDVHGIHSLDFGERGIAEELIQQT
jgi:hypothetical protein